MARQILKKMKKSRQEEEQLRAKEMQAKEKVSKAMSKKQAKGGFSCTSTVLCSRAQLSWTVCLSVCLSGCLLSALSSRCVLVCVSVSACVKEREIDVRH